MPEDKISEIKKATPQVPFEGKYDPVEHPKYYNEFGLQTIDVIKGQMPIEGYYGFLQGQTTKYLGRWRGKQNPVQDLEKAEFYLKCLIREVKEHQQESD